MKKVAVLTTHRANNFGAVLQAFALVMAIKRIGAEGVVLDWRCPHYEWQYHKAWRIHRNPIPAFQYLLRYFLKENHARKLFSEFRDQIPMSEPIYKRMDLYKYEDFFDSVIVGSDQVWNPINSAVFPQRFDRTYLLDFIKAKKKKNAYAASIGVNEIEPDELVSEFVSAWRSYNMITMREYAGAKYVEKMIKQPIHTVLDPVLLHDSDFWLKLARPAHEVKKPYVFLYNVRCSKWLYQQAKNFARNQRTELVEVLVPGLTPVAGGVRRVTMGPREFLNAINETSAVFTNSFHASAFSVIFGKRLYLHRRNTKNNPNTRIDTLFQNTSVSQKQYALEVDNEIIVCDCASADRNKLKIMRNQSYNYLSSMIS